VVPVGHEDAVEDAFERVRDQLAFPLSGPVVDERDLLPVIRRLRGGASQGRCDDPGLDGFA